MSKRASIDDNVNRIPSPGMEKLIVDEAVSYAFDHDVEFPEAVEIISKKHGFRLTYEDIYEIIKAYSTEESSAYKP